MNGVNLTNPLDSYFALLNASADGIQQSLTASFYTLQAEVIWSVVALVTITIAVRALTCRSHAGWAERAARRERPFDRELRQLLWELLLRDAQRFTFYRVSDHLPLGVRRKGHQGHQDRGNAA